VKRHSPIPASIPRDRLLYVLRRHDKDLARSLIYAEARYVQSRDVVEAVFTFDPHEYLRITSRRPRRRT